jgi:arylsulfatase A-like enzyme
VRVRIVPLLVLAALPACFLFEHRGQSNVLMIVVDSLRFDAFSRSLGAAKTPNLQILSSEGLTFRSCYAQSSVTLPAHAAILSSQEPHSSKVRNDGQAIDASVPLLAEHLKDQDWRTFADVSTEELEPVARGQGIDRGFDTFRTHQHNPANAEDVNEHVRQFIENVDPKTPWFAYVHYSDPARADELVGTKEITAKVFLDGAPIGTVRTRSSQDWSVKIDVTPGPHRLEFRSEDSFNLRRLEVATESSRFAPEFEQGRLFAPMQKIVTTFVNEHESTLTCRIQAQIRGVQGLAECRARYKEQVESVDRAIGELIAILKNTGQYEKTIIVVTGSHGEALGEHGVTGHDITLYDEVLRVPLVIKPVAEDDRRVTLGKRQYTLLRHTDLAPTILELAGVRAMPSAQGLSLLQEGRREVTAETHPPEAPSSIVLQRDERFKMLYVAAEDRFEMYDVKSDTLETFNIFELQGHFRLKWQTELRDRADDAPQTANLRSKFAPVAPVGDQRTGPQSVKN